MSLLDNSPQYFIVQRVANVNVLGLLSCGSDSHGQTRNTVARPDSPVNCINTTEVTNSPSDPV